MDSDWRLAFMFDAPGGDLGALEAALIRSGQRIASLAGDARVRTGVADQSPALGSQTSTDYTEQNWRGVDGALEITLAPSRVGALADIAKALRPVLDDIAAPTSIEVMTGPMFPIVPQRAGGAFLSLAFKRDPTTTLQQFQDWWLRQHSGVATPVLGPGMLAYDQVHVDHAVSETVARAFGVPPVYYDAYDNLTFADAAGFVQCTSDAAGMARIFADEVGRIDNSSRRNALMRQVG